MGKATIANLKRNGKRRLHQTARGKRGCRRRPYHATVELYHRPAAEDGTLVGQSPNTTAGGLPEHLRAHCASPALVPWCNGTLYRFDTGNRRSGEAKFRSDGVAEWPSMRVWGWPGAYLMVVWAAGSDADAYKIEPLVLAFTLESCQFGEMLDLEAAAKQFSSAAASSSSTGGVARDRLALISGCQVCPLRQPAPYAPSITRCPNSAACTHEEAVLVFAPPAADGTSGPAAATGGGAPASDGGGGTTYIATEEESTVLGYLGVDDLRSVALYSCLKLNGSALISGVGDGGSGGGGGGLADDVGCYNTTYMTLLCAPEYEGNLCGTCVPGYSLDSNFQCSECPPLGRTIGLGLFSVFIIVTLIVYTAFKNVNEVERPSPKEEQSPTEHADSSSSGGSSAAEEETDTSDIIKVVIVHVQFYIIICRLNIDYPPLVTSLSDAFRIVTGIGSPPPP
ncbi:hypothetical protein HYH02_013989 [Chlamydomonas schloesseri]|uniref:Tyrosine-protein kinase ephrin type A/B receptor-like domain-containing protein n=1 Tax=Chlamydomonas schloesseri TaxID=2026947 RepID=A0A835SWQ1_9CHLO|nr:hypothetical protein HYH02_013989 [Chlamydomonas schloesseri]|eukprot:KAG2429649.1 hypothetical protein HYH02_013989 [Chlamydomonas schloesseri]